MITSLKSIQGKCGKTISLYNVRTALKRFETYGFLTNQSTKHNRLITLCNWERYQSLAEQNDNPAHSQPTVTPQTPHKHPTSNKNVKKDKNEKKGKPPASFPLSFEQQDIQRATETNDKAMQAFMEESN